MRVMPTCTVDKKRVGFSASSSATWAPAVPCSAMRFKRDLREATKAISAVANKPLAKINTSTTLASSTKGDMPAW